MRCAWDWPEARYDLIALIYVHLVESERRIVHAKALKALKSGGLIVLEAFRPEQLLRHAAGARGGPRDKVLLYSVAALQEDFSAEEILLLEEAEARVDEGHLHVGESAVVRAVVRKGVSISPQREHEALRSFVTLVAKDSLTPPASRPAASRFRRRAAGSRAGWSSASRGA